MSPSDRYVLFSDRYVLEDVIGKGTGGVIRRAADRDGNAWAVKITDDVDAAVFEYSYGRIMHHPCLCASREMYVEDSRAYIVMELMETDLRAVVARTGPLTEKQTRAVICRIASGLEYMHDHGSVHRDVKPANIMLARAEDFDTAQLGDFGLSEDEITDKVRGTPGFMAPEIAKKRPLGPPVDMYALGATMKCLLDGRKASKYAADLMARLTVDDPDSRPTASETLDHPFCNQSTGNPCSHAIQRALGCM